VSGHERERLSAWIDDELVPADRAQVDAHLAACEECSAFLADLAAADRAAASLPAEAPDGYFDGFAARVRGRIEAAAAETRPRRLPAWTWAAAAALVLAVVTPLTLRHTRTGPEVPTVAAPADSLAGEAPGPATLAPEPKREETTERPVPPSAQVPPAEAASAASPAGPPATARGRAEGDFARDPSLPPPPPAASAEAQAAVADAAVAQAPAPLAAPETGSRAKPGAQAAEAVRAPREPSAEAPGLAAVGGAADSEVAFRRLDAVRPRSADGWRRLRDEWTAFVTAHPDSPLTDEARVRAIEAGYEAWLTAGDPDDGAAFRRDARAYLERADARQAERVRRLLPPGR
jgi:hypothetical protein